MKFRKVWSQSVIYPLNLQFAGVDSCEALEGYWVSHILALYRNLCVERGCYQARTLRSFCLPKYFAVKSPRHGISVLCQWFAWPANAETSLVASSPHIMCTGWFTLQISFHICQHRNNMPPWISCIVSQLPLFAILLATPPTIIHHQYHHHHRHHHITIPNIYHSIITIIIATMTPPSLSSMIWFNHHYHHQGDILFVILTATQVEKGTRGREGTAT